MTANVVAFYSSILLAALMSFFFPPLSIAILTLALISSSVIFYYWPGKSDYGFYSSLWSSICQSSSPPSSGSIEPLYSNFLYSFKTLFPSVCISTDYEVIFFAAGFLLSCLLIYSSAALLSCKLTRHSIVYLSFLFLSAVPLILIYKPRSGLALGFLIFSIVLLFKVIKEKHFCLWQKCILLTISFSCSFLAHVEVLPIILLIPLYLAFRNSFLGLLRGLVSYKLTLSFSFKNPVVLKKSFLAYAVLATTCILPLFSTSFFQGLVLAQGANYLAAEEYQSFRLMSIISFLIVIVALTSIRPFLLGPAPCNLHTSILIDIISFCIFSLVIVFFLFNILMPNQFLSGRISRPLESLLLGSSMSCLSLRLTNR